MVKDVSVRRVFGDETVTAIAAFLAQESPKSQSRRFCRPWAFCARNAWGPSTIGQGLGEAGAPKSTSIFPEKLGFGDGGTSSFGRFRCEAQEKGRWNVPKRAADFSPGRSESPMSCPAILVIPFSPLIFQKIQHAMICHALQLEKKWSHAANSTGSRKYLAFLVTVAHAVPWQQNVCISRYF